MNTGTAALSLTSESSDTFTLRQIDYYVNGVLGNDLNSGNFDSPFATIQRAIEASDDSNNRGFNRIFIGDGTYNENLDIHDIDPLFLYGNASNPENVKVNGWGNTALTIGDSNRVYVSDIKFVNGRYGIDAFNTNKIEFNNVFSWSNEFSGFRAENVHDLTLLGSRFNNNGWFGAQIRDANHLRAVNSHFNNNDAGGLALQNLNQAHVNLVTANNNGNGFGPTLDDFGTNNGLTAHNVGYFKVNTGWYSHNQGRGIFSEESWRSSFINVIAQRNELDGLNSQFFSESEIRGGAFRWNGQHGVDVRQLEFSGTESPLGEFTVRGGFFANNTWNGLNLADISKVSLFGLDTRWNQQHGLQGQGINWLQSNGGYFFQNQWSGFYLSSVAQVLIFGLISKYNVRDGLSIFGAQTIKVHGGTFWNNSQWGINARGFFGEGVIQHSEFRNLSVLRNWGGIFLGWSQVGHFSGSEISSNQTDGLYLDNVLQGVFIALVVKFNLAYGLRYLFSGAAVGLEGASTAEASADGYESESQYEIIPMLFVGSLFCHNGLDGIFITTLLGFAISTAFDIRGYDLVSRDNGGTGLRVGGNNNSRYDYGKSEVAEYGGNQTGSPNLFLKLIGGYFGFNQGDGIYLLGVAQEEPDLGFLSAKLTDVVVQHNGGYGLTGSGRVGSFGTHTEQPPEVSDGHSYNDCPVFDFLGGSYSFNGMDGINLNLLLDEEQAQTESVPLLSNIPYIRSRFTRADFNRGSGLMMMVIPRIIIQEEEEDYFGSNGSTVITIPARFIELNDSFFRANHGNGIGIDFDINLDPPSSEEPSTTFQFNRVFANDNQGYGLHLKGSSSSSGFASEINGGGYNRNGMDGVNVSGLRWLDIQLFTTIIANKDDGLETLGVDFVNIKDAIIVANGDQNVVHN